MPLAGDPGACGVGFECPLVSEGEITPGDSTHKGKMTTVLNFDTLIWVGPISPHQCLGTSGTNNK